MRKLLLALIFLLVSVSAHAQQTFSGQGLFISQNQCNDISTPTTGQSWCFDSTNQQIRVWSGSWVFPGGAFFGFPLTGSGNFSNFSGTNINQLALVQLNPPFPLTVTATCSGTCATTYTYQVSCLSDVNAETTPSPTQTGVNAAGLSGSNFNTVSWTNQPGCIGGYNVYGRTGGALALLGTCGSASPSAGCQSATSYQDTGAVAAPRAFTVTFSGALNNNAAPALVMYDFRNVGTWIDAYALNAGIGTALNAPSITTLTNHDAEVVLFGTTGNSSGTFTPPGGFSNIVSSVNTGTHGLWAGTKDIAAAGATGAQNATTSVSGGWATEHLSIAVSNSASPVSIIGTAAQAVTGNSISFTDIAASQLGDEELICLSYSAVGNPPVQPQVPSSMVLIASSTIPGGGSTVVSCYMSYPQGTGTAPPPTVNRTGILQQATNNGLFEETLLGIVPWTANSGALFNGAGGSALASTALPMPVFPFKCRVSWAGFAGCSPFPTWAIKDTTSGTVLCSSGTVSGSNTDQNVTPSTTAVIPANDVIAFLASTPGASCTNGVASMTILFKE